MRAYTVLLLFFLVLPAAAQSTAGGKFSPPVKMGRVLEEGDSVQYVEFQGVYVYPPIEYKSEKQRRRFNALVRNVKAVLPLAKQANRMLIETYEYIQTLPDEKARQAHLKLVEKWVWKEYKPKMRRLTYSQGKLLIKLIYRECNSRSYDIIKAFLGPFRAGFYQAFASVFGASLKKEYDADGTDRLTERVVLMVEAGQI